MRRLSILLLLLASVAWPLPARAAAAAGGAADDTVASHAASGDELSTYLRIAAENNQQLQAAFERWKAAAEQVHQEGYLPEPKLSLSYYLQPVQTRAGDQRFAIGLAQSFPWFGTLSLQERRAALEADARKALLDDMAMVVFSEVKQAYHEYAYLGQATGITREVLELLVYLERVTQTRYEAGLAEYDRLIRLQVEMAKMEDRIRSLEDLRPALVAALNAAMHRPLETEIPWPQPAPQPALATKDEAILELTRAVSPQLAASRLRIEKAEAGIQLARKQYYPSFTLSLSTILTDEAKLKGAQSVSGPNVSFPASRTTEDAGVDPVVAGLQVSLPLWFDKYAAGERQAKAEKRAAAADEAALLDSLQSNARMVLVKYRDAVRQAHLYENSLAPKATQALEATVDAYQTGEASLNDLLESERTLLELRLAHARATADQAQRLAQLERLVGRPLVNDNPTSESAPGESAPGESAPGESAPGESRPRGSPPNVRASAPQLIYQLDAPTPRLVSPKTP